MNKKSDHKLILGNSLEELPKIKKESVDMIFADPPYNLQLNGSLSRPDGTQVNAVTEKWDKFNSFKEYDDFSNKWISACKEILKPDGTMWVIGSYHNIYRLGNMIQNQGFWILNDVVWIKHNPMPNFLGRRFTNAHETMLWCSKSKQSKYYFNYNAMKALNEDKQMRSDWYLPICNGKERIKLDDGKKLHPTQKPESLLYRVLLASTKQNDLILDPFSGSGTTVAVAKSLRRRAIGIEQDKSYFKYAKKRINNITPLNNEVLKTIIPPSSQDRIPFGKLVESGILTPGTKLESMDKKHHAKVTVEGLLQCGTEKGSIHTLGAKLNGSSGCNGWTYWHVNSAKKLIPLDSLRQYFRDNYILSSNNNMATSNTKTVN